MTTPGADAESAGPPVARRIILAVVGVLLLAVLAAVLWYRAGRADRAAEASMVETLDRLVTAQEGIFYEREHYATTLSELPAFRVPDGVRVEVLGASPRSWWGAATHTRLRGRRCVIWVGSPAASMPAEAKDLSQETLPYCYDAGATGR